MNMNIKRIFGSLLTVLGIAGLIFAAAQFISSTNTNDYKTLITFGILGFVFFVAGLGLIRTTKDES